MLKWGFVFLLLAVASNVLGLVDPGVVTGALSQVLFFASVVLFVVFIMLGSMAPRPPGGQAPAPAKRRGR